MSKPLVGILMGSDSDLVIMKNAAAVLSDLGIENEVLILSTHRAPEETAQYAKTAKAKGIKVIIAGAGGAAALPGSIAAFTTLPVIGVPINTKALKGVDSLFSIVSMPPGVPVATVGIDGAKNAGLLAAQIIGTSDPKVSRRFEQYKETMKKEVLQKNTKILSSGWEKYLQEKLSK
jgi:5-(carboxyamino)imidazole ribonucleotide mutase